MLAVREAREGKKKAGGEGLTDNVQVHAGNDTSRGVLTAQPS